MTKKLYAHYNEQVIIIHRFQKNGVKYAIISPAEYGGELKVTNIDSLTEWEKSYSYLKEQERKERIEAVKKEEEQYVQLLGKKALKDLQSRMRINIVFGEHDNKTSQVGLALIEKLKEIIDSYKDLDDIQKLKDKK